MTGATIWGEESMDAQTECNITPADPNCRYQRAWIDFLEDQLVQFGYDWRELLDDFLYSGKQPLINNLIAGRELLRSFGQVLL